MPGCFRPQVSELSQFLRESNIKKYVIDSFQIQRSDRDSGTANGGVVIKNRPLSETKLQRKIDATTMDLQLSGGSLRVEPPFNTNQSHLSPQ